MTIALAAIRAALDSGHDVTLLIDDNFTDLVRLAIGDEPKVLSYPRRQLAQGSTWARAKYYLRFVAQLRRDKYDTALDLDGTVVSARLGQDRSGFYQSHSKLSATGASESLGATLFR